MISLLNARMPDAQEKKRTGNLSAQAVNLIIRVAGRRQVCLSQGFCDRSQQTLPALLRREV
ncbi:protein of unknown function [Serratia sp. Tan611]|nr:protein of unknown function [Serratia sp. Tan611]